MRNKATKALYHVGDLVVKRSEAIYRNAPTYVVITNQQPYERYISLSRDNQDYTIHEDYIEPYGSRETCSTK